MQAVRAASAHWPGTNVHCEYFSAPAEPAAAAASNHPFRIRLARTGVELDVPADRTIVDVLVENDVFIETSCEEGYCGTCLTRVLAGEPEHRDSVLDDDDRREFMLVCCSRARASKSPSSKSAHSSAVRPRPSTRSRRRRAWALRRARICSG
jgi:vanillate O-demethylase ferredoxin subunit